MVVPKKKRRKAPHLEEYFGNWDFYGEHFDDDVHCVLHVGDFLFETPESLSEFINELEKAYKYMEYLKN